MKKIISTLLSLSLFVTLLSCNDNDSPELIQEEEVITSVIVTLQSADNTVTLSSVDLDGDGPNEPVLSVQGLLNANATYTGSVRFLNESVAPLEDITEEVKEEAEEHQVFYSFTAPINSVTTSDNDSNGNPFIPASSFIGAVRDFIKFQKILNWQSNLIKETINKISKGF